MEVFVLRQKIRQADWAPTQFYRTIGHARAGLAQRVKRAPSDAGKLEIVAYRLEEIRPTTPGKSDEEE